MSRRFLYDTMPAADFRGWLSRHGMKPATFARLTGVRPERVVSWCKGEHDAPPWVSLLCAVVDHYADQGIYGVMREHAARTIREDRNQPPHYEAE